MPTCDVELYCECFRIAVEKGASLLEMLVSAAMQVLKVSREDALTKVAVRLSYLKDNTQFMKALLEVDDAIYCLGIHDRQAMIDRKNHAVTSLIDANDFKKSYTKATEKAAPGAAAKAKAKPKAGDAGAPLVTPLDFEQQSVNNFFATTHFVLARKHPR